MLFDDTKNGQDVKVKGHDLLPEPNPRSAAACLWWPECLDRWLHALEIWQNWGKYIAVCKRNPFTKLFQLEPPSPPKYRTLPTVPSSFHESSLPILLLFLFQISSYKENWLGKVQVILGHIPLRWSRSCWKNLAVIPRFTAANCYKAFWLAPPTKILTNREAGNTVRVAGMLCASRVLRDVAKLFQPLLSTNRNEETVLK